MHACDPDDDKYLELADELRPYQRFRHMVHHGYGFESDWERVDK